MLFRHELPLGCDGVSDVDLDRRPRNLLPTTLAQWAERTALADMFAAATGHDRDARLRGALFVERKGAVIGYGAPGVDGGSGVDSLMVNRVFVGGEGVQANPDHVDQVLERFAARGVARYFVHVHAPDQSPELIRRLALRGVARYRRPWLKLMRAPGALPTCDTSLSIVAARHEDAERFAQIAVSTLELDPRMTDLIAPLIGRPAWHAYMALDAGEPVAVGMLLVRGDVGYLNFGGTLVSARGRGAQSALLHKRLRVAFALGCRRVVSETGAPIDTGQNTSLNNMLRLGMQVIGRRDNFAPEGTTWR